jgi:hypothetical protein
MPAVENPLSKLALDYWYKVVMVASLVIFLLCGAGLLKSFPIVPTAVISLGSFFIGLGEWINHPLQTSLLAASAYHPAGVLTGHPRSNKPIGVLFIVLGLAGVGFGAYKLFQ